MSRDPRGQLQFDRRLMRRRSWLSAEELEQELAGLPDVGDKAETVGYPGEAESGESGESEPDPQ